MTGPNDDATEQSATGGRDGTSTGSADRDDPPRSTTPLDRVLADAVPDRSTAVLADWSSRDPNGVYRVRAGAEELVCKFAREDGVDGRLAREVAALERAHEAGLAPEVVAASVDASTGGPDSEVPPYHVTRPLSGSTPADTWADLPGDADPALFRRLGATLAALHERTSREECGRIVGGRDGRLDLSPRGDWHAVVLDLARRRVADLDDPDPAVEALYAGYRGPLPERPGFALRRAVYRLVRGLRPLRTFDSWGPTLASERDEAVADLADRLRESIRDRIAAVEDSADPPNGPG